MSHNSFPKVRYSVLKSPQKEAHNYHKVASLLADYGFQAIKLSDDWNGADFIAIHHEANEKTIWVQLKARLTIDKRYQGKGLWITFPDSKRVSWYLIKHDELIKLILKDHPGVTLTKSWRETGKYSWIVVPPTIAKAIESYKL